VSRLLTKQEIDALRADPPHIPAPRERYHIVVDAGHAELTPEETAALMPGLVIPLDRAGDAPVEIVANAVPVALGTLVTVGGRAAVRVISLVGNKAHRPDAPTTRTTPTTRTPTVPGRTGA